MFQTYKYIGPYSFDWVYKARLYNASFLIHITKGIETKTQLISFYFRKCPCASFPRSCDLKILNKKHLVKSPYRGDGLSNVIEIYKAYLASCFYSQNKTGKHIEILSSCASTVILFGLFSFSQVHTKGFVACSPMIEEKRGMIKSVRRQWRPWCGLLKTGNTIKQSWARDGLD